MDAYEPVQPGAVVARDRSQPSKAANRIWSAQTWRLRVCVDPSEDGGAIVRMAGELDMAGAPLIDDAVQMVPAARRREVRLDLRALSFCDCAGLNAFVSSDRLLRASGGRLVLVHPSRQVRRLLVMTRMNRFQTLGDCQP